MNQYGYSSAVIVVNVWYKHVIGFDTKTYYMKSLMSIVSTLINLRLNLNQVVAKFCNIIASLINFIS